VWIEWELVIPRHPPPNSGYPLSWKSKVAKICTLIIKPCTNISTFVHKNTKIVYYWLCSQIIQISPPLNSRSDPFYTVLRSKVLKAAHKHLPSLYPTILQAYGKRSHLLFSAELIQSTEGLQQGDYLSPPLFCLVIHALVMPLQSPLNCWYLDDETRIGPGSKVLQDLVSILNATTDIGLRLNPGKCPWQGKRTRMQSTLSSHYYPEFGS
jgi:hypothetical protein